MFYKYYLVDNQLFLILFIRENSKLPIKSKIFRITSLYLTKKNNGQTHKNWISFTTFPLLG